MGTLNASHHTAVMTNEIRMPSSCPIPKFSPNNTSTKQMMNGTQDPMYPQAYPCDDTSS